MKSLGQIAEDEMDAAALARHPDLREDLVSWLGDTADPAIDSVAIALLHLLMEWHQDGRALTSLQFERKLARSLEYKA